MVRELTTQSYAAVFNAFFLTNLKGYTAGKNLRFWVYEGNSTQPKDLIIGALGGFADRNLTNIIGRRAIRNYLMSYVHLGRKVHWNKLGTRLIRP